MKLPPMPERIARLPRNEAGYPILDFVAVIDGVADFRVIGPGKIVRAIRERRCWLCGGVLGRYMAFVIGPMCAVNRSSSEPPSHTDCALFGAQACPFLTRPGMHRRDNNLPEGTRAPAGIMNRRNPGVALVWVTRSYRLVRDGDGVLFRVGAPHKLHWYAEGRQASRAEVLASMESGLPSLQALAEQGGPDHVAALLEAYGEALRLVPAKAEAGLVGAVP